ncbi:hypothetical protein [Reticulibacter mediterranei]|uniref:hypothetical protein n=1 Tax=Reticulibacter mediterranei TaxID=2778369 RepID=UPI001C68E379|nr:hypothetical protein [Reticulibacter mediterranei]
MKPLIFRVVATFVCCAVLALFFVAGSPIASAATQHATSSTHVSSIEKSLRSGINPTNCTGDSFQILSSTSGTWCYAGNGDTPVTIPSVTEVCSGGYFGTIDFLGGNHFQWHPGECEGVDSLTAVKVSLGPPDHPPA